MSLIIDNLMSITPVDIIDIIIIAFLSYNFMMLIKETRAEQLIKGLVFIVIFWRLSEWAGLRMVNFLIKNMMTLGLVALIIVFQPELRRALEYIGRSRFLKKSASDFLQADTDLMIQQIVDAVVEMSHAKTGAIIAMERETGLLDVVEAGVNIDALVTSELIKNLFYKNSPLHDGAIVIKNNKISRASCILPLTNNEKLSSDLGTRHRAAIGLIERSDAMVVVVSEETGIISLALDGKLSRFLDANSLTSILRSKYKEIERENIFSWLSWGGKDEKNSE